MAKERQVDLLRVAASDETERIASRTPRRGERLFPETFAAAGVNTSPILETIRVASD